MARDAQLSELVNVMEAHTYQPGAAVYLKGDQGDSMFVIEKGECIIEDGEGRSKKYREAGVVARRLSLNSFDPRLERRMVSTWVEMVD